MTHHFKDRFYCEYDHEYMMQTSDGKYVLAEEAINREAVNAAEIQTLKAQLKDAKDPAKVYDNFKAGLHNQKYWAWSYQCSIACAIMDTLEGDDTPENHEIANRAAARFLKMAFDIEIKDFPEYKSFGYKDE